VELFKHREKMFKAPSEAVELPHEIPLPTFSSSKSRRAQGAALDADSRDRHIQEIPPLARVLPERSCALGPALVRGGDADVDADFILLPPATVEDLSTRSSTSSSVSLPSSSFSNSRRTSHGGLFVDERQAFFVCCIPRIGFSIYD
jgi:hypothetical protein